MTRGSDVVDHNTKTIVVSPRPAGPVGKVALSIDLGASADFKGGKMGINAIIAKITSDDDYGVTTKDVTLVVDSKNIHFTFAPNAFDNDIKTALVAAINADKTLVPLFDISA